jgi:hypothetical protein
MKKSKKRKSSEGKKAWRIKRRIRLSKVEKEERKNGERSIKGKRESRKLG